MARKQVKKQKGVQRYFQVHTTESHTCTIEEIMKAVGVEVRILPNRNGDVVFTKMANRDADGADVSRYWARIEFTRTPETSCIKVSKKYNLDTFVEFVSLKIRKNKEGVNSCWITINTSDATAESKGMVKMVGEVKYKVLVGSYPGRDGEPVPKYETKTPNNFTTESAWKRKGFEQLPTEFLASIHTGNLDIIKNAIGELAIKQGLCDEAAVYNPVWKSDSDFQQPAQSTKTQVPASARRSKATSALNSKKSQSAASKKVKKGSKAPL